MAPSPLPAVVTRAGYDLLRADFADLPDFAADNHLAAYAVFLASARALAGGVASTRPALSATPGFLRLYERTAHQPELATQAEARKFFEANFVPFRIHPNRGSGFLTGYYEPEVEGALVASADYSVPLLARPSDLVTFAQGATPAGLDPGFSAGRLSDQGQWHPYPDRAAIEQGRVAPPMRPVVWLRDAVEVFLVHVQGSARVRLPDGQIIRLGYAGRNGHPYTSIGRILIDQGHIAPQDMSLARLKAWLRAAGPDGRRLMQQNRSYIFFKIEAGLDLAQGPVGAAGVPLTALRSIAVDRTLWHYGLPFWLDAEIPWQNQQSARIRRLMIAQDTGSAIVGPARADIFFGGGDAAGALAGNIRHDAQVHVLLPADEVQP